MRDLLSCIRQAATQQNAADDYIIRHSTENKRGVRSLGAFFYLDENNIPPFKLTTGEINQYMQTQTAGPQPNQKRDKLLKEVNSE